jgi:RecB family exonuclease
MIDTLLTERDERVSLETPHLSFSRLNRYLHCPEQYRLYYIENLRARFPSSSLVFGQVVHQALAAFFRSKTDPVKFFLEAWKEVKQIDLTYSQKESWEKLHSSGQGLLEKFLREDLQRIVSVSDVEKRFDLKITSLDLPFIGFIDLVGKVDEKITVVDFKTSGSSYQDYEVALSDQLTAYQLAEPEAEQAALCVFVKTKEPRIEWHLSSRTGDQLIEFLGKAELIAREITLGHFYKRPGKWCSWCDFLPVCIGDKKEIAETLVHIRPIFKPAAISSGFFLWIAIN